MTENKDLLILEPFYGGSHKQLIDVVEDIIKKQNMKYDIKFLPAKKWHWKARTSVLSLFQQIDRNISYNTIFCSSVLNLCETVSLCPSLLKSKKIIYFHENQLVYPVRSKKDRDFQYGYNQIVSCVVADLILFNSAYNMNSFLNSISSFLKLIPDNRPKNLDEIIKPKCQVLYFPLPKISFSDLSIKIEEKRTLKIVWPHRWEFDKNPETFFNTLLELKSEGFIFKVSVLGESFQDVPEIFSHAQQHLGDEYIEHFGRLENKTDYYEVLKASDVVVSTAYHEFFGVAVLEAVSVGCFPLCPNRLVYPEIYPEACIYNTDRQLYKRLRYFIKNPHLPSIEYKKLDFDLNRFKIENLEHEYLKALKNQIDVSIQ